MTVTQAPTPGPLSASDIAHVRDYWSAICDSDWHLIPADIRDDLEERLAAVGLAEWRAVTDDDLEDTFAYERGIEKGRSCLDLTALGHLAFKADADGWMPWSGVGASPVPLDQLVEYRLRSGETYTDPAGALFWPHTVDGHDIIAFRLALTAPVEASGSEREADAWKWLGQLYPNDAPSDLAYDANEMVDAFLAGSGRSDRMAKALERIADEQQYRSGYCQTDITVEPALTAEEAQTVAREALAQQTAPRPQPSGETRDCPHGLHSVGSCSDCSVNRSMDDQPHAPVSRPAGEGETTQHTPRCWGRTSYSDEMAHCHCKPAGEGEREAVAILKGIGKIDGDGWKDTTTKGEVVYVWNAEKPSPYAPGQYPRIGNEGWSASTSQYDFTPATADDVPAIIALLSARPAPVASSDQPEQGALEVVAWPVVTDQWTETYCELTGRDPDGKQVTFVDGATVTTFRDMAKREIEAMLCAAPKAAVRAIAALTPPAEPVSRPSGEGETTQHTPCCWGRTSYSDEMAHCYCKPAGEGEREAVARLICYWSEPSTCHDAYCSATCRAVKPDAWVWKAADAVLSLLSPAAPDAGGGWMPIETAPKDGAEFQGWVAGRWEPRCRHDPETGALEIWGRVDYDEDGWAVYPHAETTHWMPLPAPPALQPGGER